MTITNFDSFKYTTYLIIFSSDNLNLPRSSLFILVWHQNHELNLKERVNPTTQIMYHHHNHNHNQNGSLERRAQASNGDIAAATTNGNGVVGASNLNPTTRLLGSPRGDHMPDNYEDLPLDFNPLVFTSLERHLPSHILNLSRDLKAHYMSNILLRYLPHSERVRVRLFFFFFSRCPEAFFSLKMFYFHISLIKIWFWSFWVWRPYIFIFLE